MCLLSGSPPGTIRRRGSQLPAGLRLLPGRCPLPQGWGQDGAGLEVPIGEARAPGQDDRLQKRSLNKDWVGGGLVCPHPASPSACGAATTDSEAERAWRGPGPLRCPSSCSSSAWPWSRRPAEVSRGAEGSGAARRDPVFSLSPAPGKELGPGCLSRPPAAGCERLPGQPESSPSVEEPAWGRARRLGPGARGGGGGFLQWLGRNSCRQRWGRGCPGIWESEVNYLS